MNTNKIHFVIYEQNNRVWLTGLTKTEGFNKASIKSVYEPVQSNLHSHSLSY
jgi:hypothetical protein